MSNTIRTSNVIRLARRTMFALRVLAPLAGGTLGAQGAGRGYQDPGGRFTVTVPSGWTAAAQRDAVMITSGGTTVVITPVEQLTTGETIVGALSQQFSRQWKDLAPVGRGAYSLSGSPAAYAMYTGRASNGAPSLLRISGVVVGGQGYAIIISAPQQEFNAVAPALETLENSFAVRGGRSVGAAGWDAQPPAAPRDVPRSGGDGGGGATLGVGVRDVEAEDLASIGITEARGALVQVVVPGGPAGAAGMKEGDVVLTVGQQSVIRAADLVRNVGSHRPGDEIVVTFLRQGQVQSLRVRLAAGQGARGSASPRVP